MLTCAPVIAGRRAVHALPARTRNMKRAELVSHSASAQAARERRDVQRSQARTSAFGCALETSAHVASAHAKDEVRACHRSYRGLREGRRPRWHRALTHGIPCMPKGMHGDPCMRVRMHGGTRPCMPARMHRDPMHARAHAWTPSSHAIICYVMAPCAPMHARRHA